ncbi:MAG: ABC transporter ATP-binding protein, partial [Pseudomonadota bacterium]|nr:ABC transporter ATP-binding protein [Pseudomonadota bacterium]
MIDVKHLKFRYSKQGQTNIVNDLCFNVSRGEVVCLLGPSGCGKTSTLRLLAGLETPDSGSIHIEGKCVADKLHFIEPHQRGIGYLFQDFALFPHLNVEDNIGWGLVGLDRKSKKIKIDELLNQTCMASHAKKYPHELSGGEQQRVSLARALAPGPGLLLLDEPFSSLDTTLRHEIRTETSQILRDTNTTAIIVTHDPEEAMLISDRIILMYDGKILQDGTSYELYNNPKNQFAASFFGFSNHIDGLVNGDIIKTPIGNLPNKDFPTGTNIEIVARPHAVSLVKKHDKP